MPNVMLVNASELETWADRRDAQSLLPRLVRRLIIATGARVTHIAFRADEGVHLGGWDGLVVTEACNAFVPDGRSGWELGTSVDIRRKAEEEYHKRTQDPKGVEPAQTTFVFVTPRRWRDKVAWAEKHRGDGIWRDVRAYDADDLETWLELAPAVHVWLSMQLGTQPEHASDLESAWADWSQATDPPITPDFVLAGRAEVAGRVEAWLRNPTSSTVAVQTESIDEALAVFAAVVLRLPVEEREGFLARTVVIDSVAAWNTLSLSDEPLILIARFADSHAIGRARRKGHRAVIPLAACDSGTSAAEVVPRLVRSEAEKALRAMGAAEERIPRVWHGAA